MEKHKIVVPEGIRYISEINPETGERLWDYELEDYGFQHILNKKLTGCGYTEYCLGNKQLLILTSPRKFLLDNKFDQHKDEYNVYYVKNELETSVDYELDLNKDDLRAIKERAEKTEAGKKETEKNLDKLKTDLRNAVRAWNGVDDDKPFKILVTYDSFRHVKDALTHFYDDEEKRDEGEKNIFPMFQVVVDEFQSIFIDSRFKSETEIELLDQLRGVQKVCYVSATPMLDKYLEKLDEFKDLPYYELDWETEDPSRTVKPKLEIKFVTTSLNKSVNTIIKSYQDGRFETRLDPKTGQFIESREAVLFLNSVSGICQAIRSNRLHLDQVNVICAKSTSNETKVRTAFNDVIKKESEEKGIKNPETISSKEKVIGRIPLEGEPHKMFTFCTRTVYLGADFYSLCARTFIFSDSNIQCLAVDISMDLEQILGRQRLKENPWKNSALMYVKTTSLSHKIDKEEFDEYVDKKLGKSNRLLKVFDNTEEEDERFDLADNYQKVAQTFHYRDDYVAVTRIINRTTGKVVKLQPVLNKLVLITEQRAFELQQNDYADRFSVFASTQSKGMDSIENEVEQKVEEFEALKTTIDRFRMLLEYSESTSKENLENFLELIPGKYKDYYTIVGPEIIKACGCDESKIKKKWRESLSNNVVEDDVVSEIYKMFKVGQRYTKVDIKNALNNLYERKGYQKKAKATDLELYYLMKPILTPDKKHGFELIGKR
jgi:hypothetical protein